MNNIKETPKLKYANKYQKLFKQRAEAWLNTLQTFSNEELMIKPTPTSWSLNLLYDHIIKVAESYQIKHAKQTTQTNKRHKKNALGWLLLDLNILPKMTLKMENFPEDLVQKFTPILKEKQILVQDFKNFIEEVNQMFITHSDAIKKTTKKHPMFGHINNLEWLRLVEIHMKHHEKQKSRIIKAIQKG